MIHVRYIYSACVEIKTADVSILCDPWFTDGAYEGSWYQYPKLHDPIEKIGPVDLIYVSHIHPDHYDPLFLHAYLKKFPTTKIIIGNVKYNYLSKKMAADHLPYQLVDELKIGHTEIKIVGNREEDLHDIDTALCVKYGDHSVINMNDNLYSEEQIQTLLKFGGHPKIALLGYTGAGPYPQTYYPISPELIEKAHAKKITFFERYKTMQNALKSTVTIPFAGKYILGSRLHHLTPYRGVADAVEVTEFDKTAIVLADGGQATINTSTLQPTAIRTQPYDPKEIAQYAASLAENPMDYDTYFRGLPTDKIIVPLKRLLAKAYPNALAKSFCEEDFYHCIKLDDVYAVFNVNKNKKEFRFEKNVEHILPRTEITIDLKYLYGLLTYVFHWNNADTGSQFYVKRVPDVFNRDAYSFLNFFQV